MQLFNFLKIKKHKKTKYTHSHRHNFRLSELLLKINLPVGGARVSWLPFPLPVSLARECVSFSRGPDWIGGRVKEALPNPRRLPVYTTCVGSFVALIIIRRCETSLGLHLRAGTLRYLCISRWGPARPARILASAPRLCSLSLSGPARSALDRVLLSFWRVRTTGGRRKLTAG